jgi:hypothetical protein
MGSCFSLEGGRSESIVPAQRSQIPEDEQVEPTVTSELAIPVPGSRSFVLALLLRPAPRPSPCPCVSSVQRVASSVIP